MTCKMGRAVRTFTQSLLKSINGVALPVVGTCKNNGSSCVVNEKRSTCEFSGQCQCQIVRFMKLQSLSDTASLDFERI